MLTISLFSLAGIPPTAGFFGKFFLIMAGAGKGNYVLIVIAALNMVVSLYYYLRVVKATCFDQAETPASPVTYSPMLVIVLAVTALGTLGLGFFPERLLELSRAALFAFL